MNCETISEAQFRVMTKCCEELGGAVRSICKTINLCFEAECDSAKGVLTHYDNRLDMTAELGDVLACIDTLVAAGCIDLRALRSYKLAKIKNLAKQKFTVPACPRCLSPDHVVQDCEALEITGMT
jgi:hypothetical protein